MKILTACAVAALSIAIPAQAHHSGAMFDNAKTIRMVGIVKGLEWTNPHAWLSVVTAPGQRGAGQQWDFETLGPGSLVRLGLKKEMLQEGAKVTIDYHPLRDGRRGGSLVAATFPDGRTISIIGKPLPTAPSN